MSNRKRSQQDVVPVKCGYCGGMAKLQNGKQVYPHRSDLAGKMFYVCIPCEATVGCHGKTTKPKGMPAKAELRKLRIRVHAAFDPLWKQGKASRTSCYKWLAKEMDLQSRDCHIGMFNEEQCKRAMELIKSKPVLDGGGYWAVVGTGETVPKDWPNADKIVKELLER